MGQDSGLEGCCTNFVDCSADGSNEKYRAVEASNKNQAIRLPVAASC